MVWVYGGAFYSGSNNLYGMERIGDVADVILVAINYRIGSLGIILKDAFHLYLSSQLSVLQFASVLLV